MASQSCTCAGYESHAKQRFGWPLSLGPALRLLGNRQRLSLLWLIVTRVLVGLCDLLLAGGMYLLLLFLQGFAPPHPRWWMPATTLSTALITATLVVVRALLDLSSTRAIVCYTQKLYAELLLRLTRGYNAMQWGRYVQRNRSELLNHAMYTAREAANFYYLCIEIIGSTVVVIAMAAALIYRSSAAAFGLGIATVVFYGVHRFILREKLRRAGSERDHSLRLLQRSLAEMFSSGKEIRSYGIEAFFHNRIARHARSAAAGDQRAALLQQIARILADQGVVLLFLCVVIAVQARHGDTRQLLSLLVYYFVLSRRLLPLVSQISLMAGQMESSCRNVQIVAEELDDCSLHRTVALAPQASNSKFVLELDQVSFSFCEGPSILRDVTMRVGHGEVVVLHGVSGSGKSSLLNLAAGVLQPTAGVVRADRAAVAYVPQDTALLDDTIRNNLLFGMLPTGDAELRDALAVSDLTEFVAAQPLGLDAQVGDNGVLFSGGQRQRLGLARAVLRHPHLLLLDEATSALDERSESHVLANLSSSGMAVLLVTHRTVRPGFTQRVLHLQRGNLREEAIESASEPEVMPLAW